MYDGAAPQNERLSLCAGSVPRRVIVPRTNRVDVGRWSLQIAPDGLDFLSAFQRASRPQSRRLPRGRIICRASNVQERSCGLDVGAECSVQSPRGLVSASSGFERRCVGAVAHQLAGSWHRRDAVTSRAPRDPRELNSDRHTRAGSLAPVAVGAQLQAAT